MSGRLSSNSEGTPAGIGGGGAVSGSGGSVNSAGRLADQHGNRMLKLRPRHADVDSLSTGCFQLGSGLFDLDIGGQSSLIAVLIQLQCIFVLDDGILQKLLFCIQTAGCEVIKGQVGMHAEIDTREIGSAGLCLGAIGLDSPTDASPDVSFVVQFKRQNKVVKGDTAEGRAVGWAIVVSTSSGRPTDWPSRSDNSPPGSIAVRPAPAGTEQRLL